MPQNLPEIDFERIEKSLHLLENLYKATITLATKNTSFLRFMLVIPRVYKKIKSDFQILADRVKMNKCQKFVCKMHDKENCVIHMKALKLALDYGVISKNVHRVI